jgi:hypothetical protein
MERNYLYKGCNLRVATQVCACLVPIRFKTPDIGYVASVTITLASTGITISPPITVTQLDGRWFASETGALFAAKAEGQRMVDEIQAAKNQFQRDQ